MKQQEIPYIHYVRVLALFLVLGTHCNHGIIYNNETDRLFADIVHTLCQPCVPLFFMITGVLILSSINFNTSDLIITFYKKRISKILFPLITWSIVYSILPYFVTNASFKSVAYNLIWSPIQFPKEMGGILWYLWALIGIYLIIPFVNHNIYSNIKIQNIYLILWVIAALGLVIRVFNPEIWGETHWINSYNMLYYFSGYFGYLLLGTRIHNYGKDIKYHYLVIGLIVSLLLTYCVRQELFGISWGNQRGWFVFPTSILISYFTFKLFSITNFSTNSSAYRLVKIVSKHSFGIYLSHTLFYRLFMRQLIYQYSTAWYTQIATIIIVFFISLFFCITISKLPFHKYIM